MSRDVRHIPVLLRQVLRIMSPQPGQVVADCALGLGGHAEALLNRIKPEGRLIGIDFDPVTVRE